MTVAAHFYVLWGTDKNPTIFEQYLQHPLTAGATIRFSWKKLQPTKNVWDWEYLKKAIGLVRRYGKAYNLRMMTGGDWCPPWAYDDVIGGIPDPRDAKLIGNYKTLIQALAGRYDYDPLCVGVNHPDFHKGAEWTLPAGANISDDDMVAAHMSLVSELHDCFEETRVLHSLHHSVSFRDQLLAEIRGYTQLHRRGLGIHNLSAKANLQWEGWQLFAGLRDAGEYVWFQMLSGSGDSRFGGVFSQGVDKGLQLGAEFLEIYFPDVANITAGKVKQYAFHL